MRSARTPIAIALLALCSAVPAAAQEPPADAMADIAAALTRIAEAMELQLESGRLDLLMRRQDLSQRRLDRVETQLRSARREAEGQRQNLSRSEMELARLADPEKAEMMGWDPATLELQLESMEFDLELTRRRIVELDGVVSRLEQDQARLEREVEDWQAFMDRELTGLQ